MNTFIQPRLVNLKSEVKRKPGRSTWRVPGVVQQPGRADAGHGGINPLPEGSFLRLAHHRAGGPGLPLFRLPDPGDADQHLKQRAGLLLPRPGQQAGFLCAQPVSPHPKTFEDDRPMRLIVELT